MGGLIIKNVIAVLFVLVTTANCELPSYIHACARDTSDLSECIINSIEVLKPKLKEGIPEIRVPALEPLDLDRIVINSLGEGSGLATNLSHIKVWGASDFKILKLKPKVTRTGNSFRFEVIIPKIFIEGDYEIDTRILFVNIKGKGPFNSSLSDYHFECNLKGKKKEDNGANHLIFEDMNCNVVVGHASIYLDNLFEGNQVLGRATNEVINDNSMQLFDAIRPHVFSAVRRRFTDTANRITTAFPYEELFP